MAVTSRAELPDSAKESAEAVAPPRLRLSRLAVDSGTVVCALVAVAGIACGGWFGWSWWSAAHDPVLTVATTRDAVLDVGRQDLVTLNTVHYQNPEQDLRNWLDITTGQLHDDLGRDREGKTQGVRAARTSSTATVVDAALTALDTAPGKASLAAVLEVTLTVDGRPPATSRTRLIADLTRTQEGWRVSGLTAMTGGGTR